VGATPPHPRPKTVKSPRRILAWKRRREEDSDDEDPTEAELAQARLTRARHRLEYQGTKEPRWPPCL
jgi:hypothetical protein